MGISSGIITAGVGMGILGFILTILPVTTSYFFGLIQETTYPFAGTGILLISIGVGCVVFGIFMIPVEEALKDKKQ